MNIAIELLRDLSIHVEMAGDRVFLESEIRIARALAITPYGAAYLVTADAIDAELVTADTQLARAARDLGLRVTEIS